MTCRGSNGWYVMNEFEDRDQIKFLPQETISLIALSLCILRTEGRDGIFFFFLFQLVSLTTSDNLVSEQGEGIAWNQGRDVHGSRGTKLGKGSWYNGCQGERRIVRKLKKSCVKPWGFVGWFGWRWLWFTKEMVLEKEIWQSVFES